jgi:oligosaccharide reducing-end xylanase
VLWGLSQDEIQTRIDEAWQQLFYGNDSNQRVYYPVGEDMAYVLDTGNNDVRSEGMSYGMMIAVQLDKKDEFDRIWKWAKTYMYQSDGPYKRYFAWHCKPDGTQLHANPAPDAEEWFVMALFFAAARWGNGDGIFNYEAEANAILHTMLPRPLPILFIVCRETSAWVTWKISMHLLVISFARVPQRMRHCRTNIPR